MNVFPDAAELGKALAREILDGIKVSQRAGKRYLLGCPGGRSLQSTYQALSAMAATEGADLSGLVIVMMDDYVFPDGSSFKHCPADAHYSCRRFGREDIVGLLNSGLPADKQIPADALWFPDPSRPADYEGRLRAAGGIDLFLLASGVSDGHVAFNPPGSARNSLSRVVTLAETTRDDNMKTFPQFKNLGEVPRHGVTVGVGTIVDQSKKAVMVIHGAHKAGSLKRLLGYKGYDESWPASLIHCFPDARIYADKAAAS